MPKTRKRTIIFAALLTSLSLSAYAPFALAKDAFRLPAPGTLEVAPKGLEKAVLAGGCFWGVQGVFQHVKGVKSVVAGYAGGRADTATYDTVSEGKSGHAEAVEILFDSQAINYATLLQIYFSVAHNPTQLNRQGPDSGTQYRSAIFADTDSQRKVAKAYIQQLNQAGIYGRPIVTKIEPLSAFYKAESYHQNYATIHPNNSYIAHNDLPKIANLGRLFPNLYSIRAKIVRG